VADVDGHGLNDQLTRFMIAVSVQGTALSAAQPPQTTIMDGIPGGRDIASAKTLLNATGNHKR
jgi:hypothetical protein